MSKKQIYDKQLLIVPIVTVCMVITSTLITTIDFTRSLPAWLIACIYAVQAIVAILMATKLSMSSRQTDGETQ
jgi:hypothetical protein